MFNDLRKTVQQAVGDKNDVQESMLQMHTPGVTMKC